MTEKSVADPDIAGLIERLNGRYTIPVNDGAGLLNGKDTFSRTFTVPSIQLEAAAALQRQADQLAEAKMPQPCCGEYFTCTRSCTPRGREIERRWSDEELGRAQDRLEASNLIVVAAKQAHANAQFRAEAAEKELAEARDFIAHNGTLWEAESKFNLNYPEGSKLKGQRFATLAQRCYDAALSEGKP